MRWRLLVWLGVCLPGLCGGGEESSGSGLTADELVIAADGAYSGGDFPRAASLYEEFIGEYAGSGSQQIGAILKTRRVRLALSYVQSRDFERAQTAIADALSAQPAPDLPDIAELTFWKGVGELQLGDPEEAIASLRSFESQLTANDAAGRRLAVLPVAAKLPEARRLIGTAMLVAERFAEAGDYFAEIRQWGDPGRRATVLQLHAVLQADDLGGALGLVRTEFGSMEEVLQVVAFQSLILSLGDRLLAEGRLRDAIFCFQRIWSQDRLLDHQRNRLSSLRSRLEAELANPHGDPFKLLQHSQEVTKIEREIQSMEKMDNFDAAVRLRLARSYYAMARYLECALIMEEMLGELPPSDIVESGTRSLVQAWLVTERWTRAARAAELYASTFPKSKNLPEVLYLSGLALQKARDYEAASVRFNEIVTGHTGSPFAAPAQFQIAFTTLLLEQYASARDLFAGFLKRHGDHELTDAAMYWKAMALSMAREFGPAREEFLAYGKDRPTGSHAGSSAFRAAYCAQQMEDYPTAITELEWYLKRFPGGGHSSEARVLMGDAHMALGDMEAGIAVLRDIDPNDTLFYEEGIFKTAKALRLLGEEERLLHHLETFIAAHPQSARVAEAIFLAGRIHLKNGNADRARHLYWNAIEKHGSDPAITSVEQVFTGLQRLYSQSIDQYIQQLESLEINANDTLRLRTLWARGNALRKKRPAEARKAFLAACGLVKPESTSPAILADLARTLAAEGEHERSRELWTDLVKWNPRAAEKGEALAALGLMAMEAGDRDTALAHFRRFGEQVAGSAHAPKVLLAHAALLEEVGQPEEARQTLSRLLEEPAATGKNKAEAMVRIGESYLAEKNARRAIPYFQQVYVMHARWEEWVARAYLKSAEAFEVLGDSTSARNTYEELVGKLPEAKESARARERLKSLSPPVNAPSPRTG